MKKALIFILPLAFLLGGCATLSVKTPEGMGFISTGDYTPGVKTLGLASAKKTVWMPLFLFDLNGVRKELYEEVLTNAKAAGGYGVTNINFFFIPSPWTITTLWLFSPWVDFYMEGWVVVKE